MYIDREGHLHRIGFFVSQSLDLDCCFPFTVNFYNPVDTSFPVGIDDDFPLCIIQSNQIFTIYQQFSGNGLLRVEVIVDIGRNDDFVSLSEKSWSLESYDQIFASDDFGMSFTNIGTMPHSPDIDLPGGQIFRHFKFDFGKSFFVGGNRPHPKRSVGKVFTYCRLDIASLRGLLFSPFCRLSEGVGVRCFVT